MSTHNIGFYEEMMLWVLIRIPLPGRFYSNEHPKNDKNYLNYHIFGIFGAKKYKLSEF